MNVEQSRKLRDPFPPELIGKLPKLNCKRCSDADGRVCDKHSKQRCGECQNWISTAHVHLDYVGHAETTDRLLEVDPEWTWEPVAFGGDGLPVVDGNGGLWIRLTVCGVTRLGYGHADGKRGGDATKAAIGDAIRNAAMRFGVALDLWAKSDLTAAHAEQEREPSADEPTGRRNGQRQPAPEPAAEPEMSEKDRAKKYLWGVWQDLGYTAEATAVAAGFAAWAREHGHDGVTLPVAAAPLIHDFAAFLLARDAEQKAATPDVAGAA